MSDYIVTGRTGENHVTAADAGALNACFAGEGRYVAAGVGEALAAEVISNNCVRIKSGEAINQGRHMRVSANTYVDCTIQNGSQSTKRYDLIVFRYTKNAETDIEKAEIVVIKGTAGSTAADPTYTAGNILAGARQDDMPLYRVRINGINIEAVDKLFTELPSLAALNEKSSKLETAVSQLNSELTTLQDKTFKVGDYIEKRNLNYTFANGIYKTQPDSENSPEANYGLLWVFNTSNDSESINTNSWICQFWMSTDTNGKAIYVRHNINYNYLNWEPWKKIALL